MNHRFRRFAWGVLLYNVAVILWGAYVRATGSGAGCGAHWPLCNGEILPLSPRLETIIEFTHRTSSGLSLVLVVALAVAAFRAYPAGHRNRKASLWSVAFVISEALVGAGIVLLKLVALDQSSIRVFSISVHLINTLLLLGSLTVTAWFAGDSRPSPRLSGNIAIPRFALGMLATILTGLTGAITALGDTLFPSASFAAGLAQDFTSASHILIRLRVIHPFLAVITGCYLLYVVKVTYPSQSSMAATSVSDTTVNKAGRADAMTISSEAAGAERLAWLLKLLATAVLAQWTLGLFNITLLAPVWMQIIHLLAADIVWVLLVVCALEACVVADPQRN